MSQQPLNNIDSLLDNVQGDILGDGFLKQVEFFDFFRIANPADFRKKLAQVVPLIASVRAQQQERARVANEVARINAAGDATSQDARDRSVASKQANIAFTFTGLQKLSTAGGNFDTTLSPGFGADFFTKGMQADAVGSLQDPPTSDPQTPFWNNAFLGRQIDGVFLIAANNFDQASQLRNQIFTILGSSVNEVINIPGSAREGQLRRHEHFGFLDGVSEPGIQGFDSLKSDKEDKKLIAPGIVLCKRNGDSVQNRPDWTADGSFLVFRWLEQRVPEFKSDLGKFARQFNPRDTSDGEMIGARIIGRWQSGALITKFPDADPLPLSKSATMTRQQIDAALNVNEKVDFTSGCPMGAHIRKMNPRNPGDQDDIRRIVRRGIQFGPEVTPAENQNKRTDPNIKRGLLFACYQSSIELGYGFIQQQWANNPTFPGFGAGVDPMVGQRNQPGSSSMLGMNKADPNAPLNIPFVNPYVIPLGGEYFFSPSMTALSKVLADNNVQPPPPPPPSSQIISCYIEDRNTGHRSNGPVPIDGRPHKFSEIWGNDTIGNWMGLSQWAADNISITVMTTDGANVVLPNGQTPVPVTAGASTDLSQYTVVGRMRS